MQCRLHPSNHPFVKTFHTNIKCAPFDWSQMSLSLCSAATHPQHAQLIAHIGGRKRDGGRTRDVGAFQFGDQIVDGQRVDFLVLRERGDGVPAEAPDERNAGGIVRRFRRHRSIKVRKLAAFAQRRRRRTE